MKRLLLIGVLLLAVVVMWPRECPEPCGWMYGVDPRFEAEGIDECGWWVKYRTSEGEEWRPATVEQVAAYRQSR